MMGKILSGTVAFRNLGPKSSDSGSLVRLELLPATVAAGGSFRSHFPFLTFFRMDRRVTNAAEVDFSDSVLEDAMEVEDCDGVDCRSDTMYALAASSAFWSSSEALILASSFSSTFSSMAATIAFLVFFTFLSIF